MGVCRTAASAPVIANVPNRWRRARTLRNGASMVGNGGAHRELISQGRHSQHQGLCLLSHARPAILFMLERKSQRATLHVY